MAKESFNSRKQEPSKKDSKEEVPDTHLYDVVGHFGRFQFLIFIFKIGIGVTSAINNLGVSFFAPREFVSYWCADDHYNQSTSTMDNLMHPLNTSNNITNTSPTGGSLVLDTFATFLRSEERSRRHADYSSWTVPNGIRRECFDQAMNRCTEFRYDTGIWISTLIEEFDFVCERSWFISWTQSLYMIGNMLAYLIFGYLSDRYGRKKTVILSALFEIFSGFGCALANSSFMYLFFRFWCGFGNAGRSSTSYLMMIEWVGPIWGITISSWGALGWGIGYTILPWISAYFLHFRHIHLFACFYEFFFVILLLFLPESPRFLLTQKRFAEAHKIIFKAAYFNGLIKKPQAVQVDGTESAFLVRLPLKTTTTIESSTQVTSQALKPYTKEEFDIKFEKLVDTMNRKEFTKKENKLTIIDLFRWEHLRFYALILYCIWASNSFIFYGIALGSTAIVGTNFFTSFSILGLMEIPGIILTILLTNYLPQNPTYTIVYALTGFLCLMEIPFEASKHPNVQLINRIIAKLLNTISFNSLLYITIEVFPTSIRQTAYSSCSLMGRIGANLAPFIKELTLMTNSYVAPVIYALLNIISAILVRLLPDTSGLDMTDTLLEADKLGERERSKLSTSSRRKLAV